MPKTIARQPYTGHAPLDDRLEKARCATERDGRLRFVTDHGVYLRERQDCVCMGAASWASVQDGRWVHKRY